MLNKKAFMLLTIFIISFFVIPSNIISVNAHNPTWWNYDWNQRLELTINSSLIDEPLTNFPVLVYINEDLINWGDVQNNLDDIRFTDDYLTELNYEIDDYTLNEEAWFHIALNITLEVDTYFFMYYDNKFCESGENAEAVWDSSFVMVQHMNDETTSTILDSTSYDNDGTKKDANEPIETDGHVGKAQQFDGSDDHITITASASLETFDEFTFSCWINPDIFGDGNDRMILEKAWAAANGFTIYIAGAGNKIWFFVNQPIAGFKASFIDDALTVGTYCYLTVTFKRNDKLTIYVNTIQGTETATADESLSLSNDIFLAQPSNDFKGYLDEPILSNVVRSSAWVGASYYSGTLELVIFGIHEHISDITLREDIDDNTLLILVVLIISGSAFTVMITQKRRK